MQLLMGAFTSVLTVVCAVGGFIHAQFGHQVSGKEKILSLCFWIIPMITAIACFRVEPEKDKNASPRTDRLKTTLPPTSITELT